MTDEEILKNMDEAFTRAAEELRDGSVDQPGSRRWWDARIATMEARWRREIPVDNAKEKHMAEIGGRAAALAAREVAKEVTAVIQSEMAALRAEMRADNLSKEDTDGPLDEVQYRRLRDEINYDIGTMRKRIRDLEKQVDILQQAKYSHD